MRAFCLFALLPLLLNAQAPKGKQTGPQACSLLSRAEVEKATGQRHYTDPDSMAGGTSCTFDNAQLYVYSGANAEARWEATLKAFQQEKAPRTPLSGLGDSAYVMFPKPANQYQDDNAIVVVKKGDYLVSMSVAAPAGKTAQSAQPQAVELAKLVLSRLR